MSKFQFDVNKAIGYKFKPLKVSYNKRDLILYALSIGTKEDEFKYLYELDKNFTPFPTYPTVLRLKGDSSDVNLFAKSIKSGGSVPGLPAIEPSKIIHGEQKIEFLNPLPTSGEFELHGEVKSVYDKGNGMLVEESYTMIDPKIGKTYCVMTSQTFLIGYGGFGGPRGSKGPSYKPPNDRKPDVIDVLPIAQNQAILYRLSGDYNPLHIDPRVAQSLGFEKPLLHGLCTYGIAAHSVVKNLANNDPNSLKSFSARFAAPIYPGDTLEIYMWKVPSEKSSETNVIFFVKSKERDAVVLGNAFAVLKNVDENKAKL